MTTSASVQMRIAYLLSKYPAANHTYLLREVAELRRFGFEVDVASISPDERPLAELTAAERRERERTFVVKRVGWRAVCAAHLSTVARRPSAYVRGLRSALRLAGPDLRRVVYHLFYFAEAVVIGRWLEHNQLARMHVHYASTVGLIVSETFPVTVSATLHGSAEFINPELQGIREKVAGFALVIAISKFGRSQLMFNSDPVHWRKIHVVPLGVDVDALTGSERRSSSVVPLRVAFVGQLQPAKGLHVLVDAVAALAEQGRRVHVSIVGDGPDRVALQAHAEACGVVERFDFLGRMNQDEVRAVYDRTDAFVLPSFAEGIPVVLMEAMACGLPCVATRITGIPELIRDGVDGLLVTPSDVGELAAALAQLVDDPALARRLAAAGQATVRSRYNLADNVALLAGALRASSGGV